MNLIAAVDSKWGIGNKRQLLVQIPADQKLFRQETMGKVIVLGRRTLETFPQGMPLAGRTNIILSRDPAFRVKGGIVVHSLEEFVGKIKGICYRGCVCGGGREHLPTASSLLRYRTSHDD